MTSYPDIIRDLPQIETPMTGVRGWLLQAPSRQAVFFELAPGSRVPEHSHGAQWGIVVAGELDLTIAGETRRYRKGDSYQIPAGAPHAAFCSDGALILDLFADPDRYRPQGAA